MHQQIARIIHLLDFVVRGKKTQGLVYARE
jgi:hypothetical protein